MESLCRGIVGGLVLAALLAQPGHAQWHPVQSGSVAWTSAGALHLNAYCNGGDASDDTTCIQAWLDAGNAQGKDLYADDGTYLYSGVVFGYTGTKIHCQSNTGTVFKNNNNVGGFLVIDYDYLDDTPDVSVQIENVRIENCGFDMNDASANYRSFLFVRGNLLQARAISIEDNRMFDSAHPTDMRTGFAEQAQYIVLSGVYNVQIARNALSGGGRIKAGQPGSQIYIHDNTLLNINDNGITIVDNTGGSTSDVLIAQNTITNPIGSCLFLGADGDAFGTPTMVLQRVTLRNNTCTGDFSVSGIHGIYPEHTAGIHIANNTVIKTGTAGTFVAGILVKRADNTTRPTTDITVQGNQVYDDQGGKYGELAGIYITGDHTNICVSSNDVDDRTTSGSWSDAIRLNGGTMRGDYSCNTVHSGGEPQSGTLTIDTSGSLSNCYQSPF